MKAWAIKNSKGEYLDNQEHGYTEELTEADLFTGSEKKHSTLCVGERWVRVTITEEKPKRKAKK